MAKVKMSDIRAKFPMYADVSDEQLLMGLRRKYYSDIPQAQFYSNIEFDTGPDPTEGMSGAQKFLAGVGKGMTDVARGIGQMVGAVSRDDVARSRKRDEALTRTGAGMAGNVAGAVATMLPTAFIPGAATLPGATAIGLATGLAAPSVSTEETLRNTALGGILSPTAVAVGRGLGATARGAQSLMEPFTKKGQERVAARTLQQFATDPQKAATSLSQAREIVPGSLPTMAQGSDDIGLAQLERTLVNNQETGKIIGPRFADQRAARLSAVESVAGTPAARDAAVAARSAATDPLYKAATSQTYTVDDALQSLLKRPAVEKAIARATSLAQNRGSAAPLIQATKGKDGLILLDAKGGVLLDLSKKGEPAKITGQGLQDLKMAIDDMLSDPMAGIGKNEANAVKGIRQRLIDWMENANPAFKQARETFGEMSKPVNTMDVASDLLKRMESPLSRAGDVTQREMKDAYARALEQSMDSVKKQVGIDIPLEKVMSPENMRKLKDVAADMARSARAENAGRAPGSNTAQNLAAQNLMRRVLGPTGLPETWAESNVLQAFLSPYTGLAKLSGSENAVMDLLAQAALDPARANALLTMSLQPSRAGLLGAEAMRYIPAGSAGLLGQLPQ